jgi:hypothetical protein
MLGYHNTTGMVQRNQHEQARDALQDVGQIPRQRSSKYRRKDRSDCASYDPEYRGDYRPVQILNSLPHGLLLLVEHDKRVDNIDGFYTSQDLADVPQ